MNRTEALLTVIAEAILLYLEYAFVGMSEGMASKRLDILHGLLKTIKDDYHR